MLMFGRNQHNSGKQLSFNLKVSFKKVSRDNSRISLRCAASIDFLELNPNVDRLNCRVTGHASRHLSARTCPLVTVWPPGEKHDPRAQVPTPSQLKGKSRDLGQRPGPSPSWQEPSRSGENMCFPGGAGGKEPTCQRLRPKGRGFNLWVEQIP